MIVRKVSVTLILIFLMVFPLLSSIADENAEESLRILAFKMLDSTNGWAFMENSGEPGIYRTTDGGKNWYYVSPIQKGSERYRTLSSRDYRTFFLDKSNAWVAIANYKGESEFPKGAPIVYHTTDGGSKWQVSDALPQQDLADYYFPIFLQFVNERVGWLLVDTGAAAGHQYVTLYRTLNGGATWKIMFPSGGSTAQMNVNGKSGMFFIDEETGWVTIGVSPYDVPIVDVTENGGVDWKGIVLSRSKVNCFAYSPFVFSHNRGFVLVECKEGEKNSLYWTSDGGRSWKHYNIPGSIVYFADEDIGWSWNEYFYFTVNGGKSWRRLGKLDSVKSIQFSGKSEGWAVTGGRKRDSLFRTSNGGKSWIKVGINLREN